MWSIVVIRLWYEDILKAWHLDSMDVQLNVLFYATVTLETARCIACIIPNYRICVRQCRGTCEGDSRDDSVDWYKYSTVRCYCISTVGERFIQSIGIVTLASRGRCLPNARSRSWSPKLMRMCVCYAIAIAMVHLLVVRVRERPAAAPSNAEKGMIPPNALPVFRNSNDD